MFMWSSGLLSLSSSYGIAAGGVADLACHGQSDMELAALPDPLPSGSLERAAGSEKVLSGALHESRSVISLDLEYKFCFYWFLMDILK